MMVTLLLNDENIDGRMIATQYAGITTTLSDSITNAVGQNIQTH